MTMVSVPAGDFTMGTAAGGGNDDERPVHKVTLDGFWIDRTEVTNAQYRAFVGATGHRAPTTCDWGDPTYDDGAKADHPVVCVSWDDAKAYCEWAGARLPTEAEWEKAARGTDGRYYPWGSSWDGSRVNTCDTNCESSHKNTGDDDGYAGTAPVGSYPTGASPYGALEMAGNVWEWVSDWYAFGYYGRSPQSNPQGPNSGQYRVLRGGSWYGFSSNARTGFRAWSEPDKRDVVMGFRCVVSSTPSP
jgi:eukaryotic-like serine/threonine-protein kinase